MPREKNSCGIFIDIKPRREKEKPSSVMRARGFHGFTQILCVRCYWVLPEAVAAGFAFRREAGRLTFV